MLFAEIAMKRDRIAKYHFPAAKHALAMAVVWAVTAALPTRGDVVGTGDVVPADAATWTSATVGYVGNTGIGGVVVDGGSVVTSGTTYVGYKHGASGTITVSGAGSAWYGGVWIGVQGVGMLNVSGGGQAISSYDVMVGNFPGSTGAITVDGIGSSLSTTQSLFLDGTDDSTLRITNGALVSVGRVVFVANNSKSKATINFGANGGTLTTRELYVSPFAVAGTGTVNTIGLITDGALTFDQAHSPVQTVVWNNSMQNVTIHMNYSGAGGTLGELGLGFQDKGTLTVADGVTVVSSTAYLGYKSGSTGVATVSGIGSSWVTTALYVGGYSGNGGGLLNVRDGGSITFYQGSLNVGTAGGQGTVSITNGGMVTSANACFIGNTASTSGLVSVSGSGSVMGNSNVNGAVYVGAHGLGELKVTNGGTVTTWKSVIGFFADGVGVATIAGMGSTWASSNSLAVGLFGVGSLTIADGGVVTANGVSINSSSVLAMDVGAASSLGSGTGTLTNSGTIRLKAVPNAVVGLYTPIAAGQWTGSGTVTAVGGMWNNTTHVFTVTAAVSGAAGSAVAMDRSVAQRLVITDATANKRVWAGFQGTTTASMVTLTGAMLSDADAAALQGQGAGGTVLAGWNFTASGYTAGEAVGLSIEIGGGYATEGLAVWHSDGATWMPFAASDLSYDGDYANFTVTGFSGYAVVAPSPVPEPGSLAMIVPALWGLVRRRRRRG
jgi:T5SS/PEP-CTERM-associated repeat protein